MPKKKKTNEMDVSVTMRMTVTPEQARKIDRFFKDHFDATDIWEGGVEVSREDYVASHFCVLEGVMEILHQALIGYAEPTREAGLEHGPHDHQDAFARAVSNSRDATLGKTL